MTTPKTDAATLPTTAAEPTIDAPTTREDVDGPSVVNAPKVGGMIDTSPTLRLPTYIWAGTNIGGEQAHDCDLCGALIRFPHQERHTNHHRMLNDICQYNGVQG